MLTFTLSTDQLALWDGAKQFVVQPGTVEVMVGSSSEHLPLSGTFEVVGQPADANENKTLFSDVIVE